MAEDPEELDGEAPEQAAAPAVDVVGMAAERLRSHGKKADPRLDAFLDEQTRLLRLQAEHLHEQRELQLEHLRLRRWRDRLALALQGLGIAAGVAAALGLGLMAWRASRDHALVVEAFSAPPSFAQRGVTGDVVAGDIMQRLDAITRVVNGAGSFARSGDVDTERSDQIKVEIPETGVSIAELWRAMRGWLGHERRVNGSLRETGDGRIEFTARLAGHDAVSVSGAAADLGQLEQQIAERIYADADPWNHVNYLDWVGRRAESLAAAERLPELAHGRLERAVVYSLWSNRTREPWRSRELALTAVRIDPGLTSAYFEVMRTELMLGHDEAALAAAHAVTGTRDADQPDQIRGAGFRSIQAICAGQASILVGDFAAAMGSLARADDYTWSELLQKAGGLSGLHDPKAAEPLILEAASNRLADPLQLLQARFDVAAERQSWRDAASLAEAIEAEDARRRAATTIPQDQKALDEAIALDVRPRQAIARLGLGDLAGAQAAIAATPLDCYACVRIRGRIAAAGHDWPAAERWFAEAARQAPSLPFAYTEWGQMLLAKGDADAAIAKLTLAHAKGPRFADPLELWGEALLKKGDVAGATAKFREARQDAPNWERNRQRLTEAQGRNHG